MAEKKTKVDSRFLGLVSDAYNNSVYSGSFTRWSSKLKSVIATAGWNEEISMNILIMKITGEAEDFYYEKKDLVGFKNNTFEEWMTSLQTRFPDQIEKKIERYVYFEI
jgi:hypothetical protein